jgi:hypothetical protein
VHAAAHCPSKRGVCVWAGVVVRSVSGMAKSFLFVVLVACVQPACLGWRYACQVFAHNCCEVKCGLGGCTEGAPGVCSAA